MMSLSRLSVTVSKGFNTYRSFCGSGKPSRAQEMVGVGVPEAMHLRDTLGPGVSVWLMNLYSSSGGEAVRGRKKTSL